MSIYGFAPKRPSFNAEKRAQDIKKACAGFGTDDEDLVKAVTGISPHQIIELNAAFEELTGKELPDVITKETSGRYRMLLLNLVRPRPQMLAHILHDSMDGLGTDEMALMDVFACATREELEEARVEYEKLTGHTLVDDVRDETSGPLGDLLAALASIDRPSDLADISREDVEADVKTFKKALKNRDFNSLTMIFTQRSRKHLAAVLKTYELKAGKRATHAVRAKLNDIFTWSYRMAILELIYACQNVVEGGVIVPTAAICRRLRFCRFKHTPILVALASSYSPYMAAHYREITKSKLKARFEIVRPKIFRKLCKAALATPSKKKKKPAAKKEHE